MTLTESDALAAEHAIHRTYLDHANDALDRCIAGAVPFSADTLRALIPEGVEPHSPNVIGALFLNACNQRRITRVDTIIPTRGSRHGNRNGLWIGATA